MMNAVSTGNQLAIALKQDTGEIRSGEATGCPSFSSLPLSPVVVTFCFFGAHAQLCLILC